MAVCEAKSFPGELIEVRGWNLFSSVNTKVTKSNIITIYNDYIWFVVGFFLHPRHKLYEL